MKHLSSLILSLALAVTVSLPGRAELLKNFKTDGSIQVRSFGIDNETDRSGAADDYRSESRTRILVGGSFDLLDDVHARVVLRKNNRLHGQAVENANSVQTALALDNANVKIDKVFNHVDLTIGRQFIGDPNSLVLQFNPNNDDVLSVGSIDAFRADTSIGDLATIMAVFGKTNEGTATSATAPSGPTNSNNDTDVFGAEIGTDRVVPKGNLAAYYFTRKIKGAGATGNDTLNVYGARLHGDVLAGLSYEAEGIANGGRNHSLANQPGYDGSAYFIGLKFGHTLGEMPLRARAEYGRGSDNFRAIAPGRRFGIIWGQHSAGSGPSTLNSVNGPGLSNLKVFDAAVGITCPKTKVGLDLAWYRFQYDANLGNVGTSAGTEYDLVLSYPHSDNVSFEVSAATFQVGDAIDNIDGGGARSPVTRLGADVKIKF